MKKLLFLLLVVGVIAIVGCAPAQPGTSREGALAGKAVDLGCDTQSVISCEDLGSGKVKVQYNSNTLAQLLGPSCNTDEFGNPVAVQFSCANTKLAQIVSACSQQCVDGEACQSGACVVVAAEPVGPAPAPSESPTILLETIVQTTATANIIHSGTSVLVEANDILVLEAPATANLGGVTITAGMTATGGAAVVVTGLEGVEHFVYVPNTRNGGVFTCPSGRTIAETVPSCPGVITYSYADCTAGTGGCSIVGSQYRVRSTGSSHGEGAVEVCADGLDNNADGRHDEGCSPYSCVDNEPTNNPSLGGTLTVTGANGQTVNAIAVGPLEYYSISLTDTCTASASIPTTRVNETICVSGSGTSWQTVTGVVGVDCPSGTTCTDPDGPFGATPAVCS